MMMQLYATVCVFQKKQKKKKKEETVSQILKVFFHGFKQLSCQVFNTDFQKTISNGWGKSIEQHIDSIPDIA